MPKSIVKPLSICILRLSAIGDVCHVLATLQAIQKQHPQAAITWVIGKAEAALFKNLSGVELIVFDKKAGIKAYWKLYTQLKNRKFDRLLHMQTAIRASLASLCISATEKWGFDRARAKEGQWLFTNRKIEAQKQPHVVDGFWAFALSLGVSKGLKPQWYMPVAEKDQHWCEQQIGTKPYIVISPAASKTERNWLSENYAQIAEHADKKGFKVVLSGGSSKIEQQLGSEIIQTSKAPIQNLTAKTNLTQLLALLKSARLLLAPDSGPAHVATLVNTPVVGLYLHSNPMRTGPYLSLHNSVSIYPQLLEQQSGKSVEDNPWGKRVKGDSLMRLISVKSVVAAFDQIIDED